MAVTTFGSCLNSAVLGAGGVNQTTTVAPFDAATQCCTTEAALFDTQSVWTSDEACPRTHKLTVTCGAGRTGEASRVCMADGTWLPESVLECVNNEIASLATALADPGTIAAEIFSALLTKMMMAVIRGGLALGSEDVRAIVAVLRSLVDSRRRLTRQMNQLVLDLISQLIAFAPSMSLTAGQEGLPVGMPARARVLERSLEGGCHCPVVWSGTDQHETRIRRNGRILHGPVRGHGDE